MSEVDETLSSQNDDQEQSNATEHLDLIGVRFIQVGKIYHFISNLKDELIPGDAVVVDTSRGMQIGTIAYIKKNGADPKDENLKLIVRRCTPQDLIIRQGWADKEADVVEICQEKVKEQNLSGVKIVGAEYSFDGKHLTILFSNETEEKQDLKGLRKVLQRKYSPADIDFKQIGPRDVAKNLKGMGACGMETRCCTGFLTEFCSISIKMAKDQGISLTPSEITGMCGRLRCCLMYEHETYTEARKNLPKRNKRVLTPIGEGKVVDVVPLREVVIVEIPDVGKREFPSDKIKLVDENQS
jgi:cell fate regulator YaaT (PSP1 superfamily)